MGRDKAMLPFRGATLAEHAAAAVAGVAGAATFVGDPGRYGGQGYPAIPDAFPGEGPLGGIVTALRHTTADWNLIVACDMPGLTVGFLAGVVAAAEASGALVLLPVSPDGHPEPLCAVWSRQCLPALEQAMAAGVRGVTAALRDLPVCRWIVPQIAHFENVNTPEDWAAHAPR
jgi:molybdopterin-guanine dinucleotide biosynthesis protein A